MSMWDGDKLPLNIPFPTMGGLVFWEDLERRKGYILQKHVIEGHCRILDAELIRVAYGSEAQMRARLRELTEPNRHAWYGDVIGVHRQVVVKGAYDHYGIYESDDRVYHFAALNGDFGKPVIHVTTLADFIGDSGNYFVLEFPETYGRPAKVSMSDSRASATGLFMKPDIKGLWELFKAHEYRLYSPDETIERAKSRLGEENYNLFFKNCEHYAIWCKTGIKESHQVNALMKLGSLLEMSVIPSGVMY